MEEFEISAEARSGLGKARRGACADKAWFLQLSMAVENPL